jgi:hypothetical protein
MTGRRAPLLQLRARVPPPRPHGPQPPCTRTPNPSCTPAPSNGRLPPVDGAPHTRVRRPCTLRPIPARRTGRKAITREHHATLCGCHGKRRPDPRMPAQRPSRTRRSPEETAGTASIRQARPGWSPRREQEQPCAGPRTQDERVKVIAQPPNRPAAHAIARPPPPVSLTGPSRTTEPLEKSCRLHRHRNCSIHLVDNARRSDSHGGLTP